MTDHQHPTAKPDGEGAPVDAVNEWLTEEEGHGIRMERLVEDLENGADIIPWLNAAYQLGRASPPVPAVAGWLLGRINERVSRPKTIDEGERALAVAKEVGRREGLKEVLAFLETNNPTPSADQSEVIGALVEALESIKALGDDGEHSGDRHARCRDIARQALAALAASIGGKS